MNRSILLLLAPLAVLLACGTASAQVGVAPYQQPTVSPYFNLARRGNTAVNYFGLVRPQFETQNALQQLRIQVSTGTAASASTDPSNDFVVTGTVPQFMNHTRYFLNQGTLAAPSRPAAPALITAPSARGSTR